jgi:hypothetical protein
MLMAPMNTVRWWVPLLAAAVIVAIVAAATL